MTNISNLNLSKGSIPPLLKYKIVFLGDQAVGKSSIINRFIYDIFDGNEHVHFLNYFRDQPLVSTSYHKIFSCKIKQSDSNCGTLQDRKDLELSFPIISEMLLLLLLSTTLQVDHHLTVSRNGLMM